MDWKVKGISKEELRMVIYGFTAIANVWPNAALRKLKSYRAMFKAICEGEEYFGNKTYKQIVDQQKDKNPKKPNFKQIKNRVERYRKDSP